MFDPVSSLYLASTLSNGSPNGGFQWDIEVNVFYHVLKIFVNVCYFSTFYVYNTVLLFFNFFLLFSCSWFFFIFLLCLFFSIYALNQQMSGSYWNITREHLLSTQTPKLWFISAVRTELLFVLDPEIDRVDRLTVELSWGNGSRLSRLIRCCTEFNTDEMNKTSVIC